MVVRQQSQLVKFVSVPMNLRIFVSSPSDVARERAAVSRVVRSLADEPLLDGQVTLREVAWDKPGAGMPLLANMTPQEAINAGMTRPSDCDIVVVILGSRLGTPLPASIHKADGARFRSGTEWEFVDAL